METLKLGERLKTREPQVLLDPELRPGRYRVQLVIESARGESSTAELNVVVTDRGRTPIGPLTPVRPIAPISRVAEIPEAAVVLAAPTSTPASKAKAKTKSKSKAKTKTPAKPKPVKPKRK